MLWSEELGGLLESIQFKVPFSNTKAERFAAARKSKYTAMLIQNR